MAIQTKEEAIAILEKYRSHVIALGRYVAYQIALRDGTVHNRQTRDQMEKMDRMPSGDERWMGAIYPGKNLFESTGKKQEVYEASPRTRGGGGGGRPIVIWRLKPNAVAPPRPPAWQGYRPPAFPDELDGEVVSKALEEMEGAFNLARTARLLFRARAQKDMAGLKKHGEDLHTLANETGKYTDEVREIGIWLAWKSRNSKTRKKAP